MNIFGWIASPAAVKYLKYMKNTKKVNNCIANASKLEIVVEIGGISLGK